MAAVFGTQQIFKGATRADKAKLQLDGVTVALAQSAQMSFTQQIAMLYEIGSLDVYYVGGRANGNATIARVVGPQASGGLLSTALGDLCGERPKISLTASGCAGGTTTYNLSGCILTSISVTVSSQDVVVNESLQFMFCNMDVT